MPQSDRNPREHLTTRALFVWAGALLVYVVAITGRTSLGVAGTTAQGHFHITNAQLAVFTSVQLGVYALSQIPVGMLIDKLGARRVLVGGAIVMAVGQILLGCTSSYPMAIFARVLVGAGDATAFLSVMRILPSWFPLRYTPLFTQLTAAIGQLGQFLSAVPFLALLGVSGWPVAFISLGATGILIAFFAAILVADSPVTRPASSSSHSLLDVFRHPICWVGFFNHGVMLMPLIVFTLLWGMPLMTLGMGLTTQQAALILIINSVANVVFGPFHGIVSARLGRRRELLSLILAVLVVTSLVWLMLPDSPRGFTTMVCLSVLLGITAPAANYGFDSIREVIDHRVVTTATGLANMGGFLSAMVAAQGIGFLLDHSTNTTPEWADFTVAWRAVFAVWLVAWVGLATSRVLTSRRARR